MAEPWDQPLPGLAAADVGVNVAPICRGRVQACPKCSAPVVFAMTVTDGRLRALQLAPTVDPRGNVRLTTTIPGNLHAELAPNDYTGDRFTIHHCPKAQPTTIRRKPNGPTAR